MRRSVLLAFALFLLAVFVYVSFALPAITYVSPTSNNSATNLNWTYINTTSGEDLSQSFLEWGNASGFTNVSMSNSSLRNWYKNMSSLVDRTYNYTIWAQNITGNWSQSARMFATVDTVLPTIAMQSPTNTSYKTTSVWFNITGSEILNWSGYSLDGTANVTMANSSGNWNAQNTSMAQGQHTIKFWANDSAGNMNFSITVYFTVDNILPTIAVQSPANTTYNRYVWFNATLNEAGSWCGYSLDGTANATMANSSGNWNAQNTSMAQGSHNVKFYCNDTAGNMNISASQTYFTVDITPPQITIQSPQNTTYNDSFVWFNVTLSEAGGWVGYSLDGAANVSLGNSSGSWNVQKTLISDGPHNIRFYANDTVGNMNSTAPIRYFTVDVPNVISFTTGTESNNSYKSQNWIYANISLNDANFKNLTFYLYNTTGLVNSTNYTGSVRSITWANLPEGGYYFNATTYDLLNASNSTETRKQTLDRTAPSVSLSLSSDSLRLGQSPTISCSASDTYAVSSESLTVMKPGNIQVAATCGDSFTGASAIGTYTATYTATDAAGNSASDSETFIVSFSAASSSDDTGGSTNNKETTKSILISTDASLTKVTLYLSTGASAASVDVVKLPSAPASVGAAPAGSVYQYVNITKKNFDESQMKNATVEFKVSKEWMNANNVTGIYLARHDNGWNRLRTELISSTSTENNYRAYTSGFSYFAVVGEQTVPAPEVKKSDDAKPVEEPAKPDDIAAPDKTVPDMATGSKWGVTIKIAAAVIALWFFSKVLKGMSRKRS